MKGITAGGMPDTMEYYVIFMIEAKVGGPINVLTLMLMVVLGMIFMAIQFDKIAALLGGL